MDDSTTERPSWRGLAGGGCILFLLCAGIVLLGWTALRVFRPTALLPVTPPAVAAVVSPAPSTSAAAALDRPSDGKLQPTPAASAIAFAALPPAIDQRPLPARAELDFTRLFTTTLPALDYFSAAEELGRVDLGERTLLRPSVPVGARATFQTGDGPREAELVYQDELAAYWVEVGLGLDTTAITAAAERLRRQYYPLLRQNFGQEWQPGVDGDPRFTVLHVLGPPDDYELGYFSDENQYPRALFGESNEREMVYLNMSQLEVGTPLYDGTLVHEVQHLIQWNLDANEDTWLNEGLSQVAETLVGLDTVAAEAWLEQPYVRLDSWSAEEPGVYAHYAGSYLYLLYLWEQAGDLALRELARHPANGLAAVRAVLAGHRPDLSLEQFTGDWAAALYLDGAASDPRYTLARAYDLGPVFLANRARQLPFEMTAALDPYAVDYIDLDFSGPAVISFAGDSTAALIEPPPGDVPFWYALPGNSGRAQLTAAVDLTGLTQATLDFSVWHDLEADYDFAYLSVSADGGQTWELLAPPNAVSGGYGPAWGGVSGGWMPQSMPLHAYAGRSILLRFDVVTDSEVTGRGFAVAGLSVPQLIAQPVWQGNGFVETGALLPQRWEVRLIREGQTTQVIPLALDGPNRAQLAVELGPEGGVLVVMPLTPFTADAADYWVSVTR